MLTFMLLDLLSESEGSRIVNVSSLSHAFLPGPIETSIKSNARGEEADDEESLSFAELYPELKGYECSKLALVLHCKALTKRIGGEYFYEKILMKFVIGITCIVMLVTSSNPKVHCVLPIIKGRNFKYLQFSIIVRNNNIN